MASLLPRLRLLLSVTAVLTCSILAYCVWFVDGSYSLALFAAFDQSGADTGDHKSCVPRVWSFCGYNGEEEILLTRLYELKDVVDYFVIAESTWSWSKYQNAINQTKPILIDLEDSNNPLTQKLLPIKSQIIHLILPPLHTLSEAETEYYNSMGADSNMFRFTFRTMMIPFLWKLLNEPNSRYSHIKAPDFDDLVYSSDTDEIIKRKYILQYKKCYNDSQKWPVYFDLKRYKHTFCWNESIAKRGSTVYAVLVPFRYVMGSNSPQCPNHIYNNRSSIFYDDVLCKRHCLAHGRVWRIYRGEHCSIIKDGGWEISGFGNVNLSWSKLQHHGDYKGTKSMLQGWLCGYAKRCRGNTSWYDQLQNICKQRELDVIDNDFFPRYMVNEACNNNSKYTYFWPKPHALEHLCK